MKKSSLLLLSVLLLFATCNKGDTDNILEKEYFTIENATFIDKDLPEGGTDLISSFSTNLHVVNGGSVIVNFTSSEELEKAFVGVMGVKGYYEATKLIQLSSTAMGINYQLVLLINQSIVVESFQISLSVSSLSGDISRIFHSEDIEVIEAGTGELQISLAWDQLDDLDLHVFDPDGIEISYITPMVIEDGTAYLDFYFDFLCYIVEKYTNYNTAGLDRDNDEDWEVLAGYLNNVANLSFVNEARDFANVSDYNIIGFLDVDSNAGCYIDAINNENIYYEATKNGDYRICVDLYEKCGSTSVSGANYSVTLNYQGRPIRFSEKQTGQFSRSNTGNYNDSDYYVEIGTFTVGSSRSAGTKASPSSRQQTINKLLKDLKLKNIEN
jgi:hypothetical protein